MSGSKKAAFTLKAQLEILLYLKGEIYRSTTEVLNHAEGLGIDVTRRTIQRWLKDLEAQGLVEKETGLFLRPGKRAKNGDLSMLDSNAIGWRWHRDSVLKRLEPMSTENRCNRLILRELMSKHNLTRDKVAELAEVSPSCVDLWLHSSLPTPIHNAYLALIRAKLEKKV